MNSKMHQAGTQNCEPLQGDVGHQYVQASPRSHWRTRLAALALASLTALPAWSASQTRTSSFEYDANGLLVKEIVEPDNSALCVVTSYTYDSYGNRLSATTRNCNGSVGSAPGINSEATAPTCAAVCR